LGFTTTRSIRHRAKLKDRTLARGRGPRKLLEGIEL